MTEPSIVERTITARSDLVRMQAIIEQSFSALCAMCNWNPNEDKLDEDDADAAEPESEVSSRPESPTSSCRDLVPVGDAVEFTDSAESASPEITAVETNEAVEDRDAICKKYAKKIAQLSHPDKLMRCSAKQKVEVLEIFHRSQEDYENRDLDALIYGYVQLMYIRGELHKLDSRLLRYVEREYQHISRQIQYLLTLPFINAVNAYCNGDISMAKTLFRRHIISVRQKRKKK